MYKIIIIKKNSDMMLSILTSKTTN